MDSKNKIAILIRGFHQLNKRVSRHDRHKTSPDNFDYRECFFSFIKMIFEPLIQEGHQVDIYVVTYHSEIDESLKFIPHLKNILFMNRDSNQPITFMKGLESIPNKYDTYIVTRYDLWYKQDIRRWLPKCSSTVPNLFVPWREYQKQWNKDNRIGDVIYVMNTEAKIIFCQAIKEHPKPCADTLHTIHNRLVDKGCIISFLTTGFFDSNPTYDNRRECCNPFYIFWGRPYHHYDFPDRI